MVKMADNLGPNGLVVSAGKCAASMAAENCTSCRKYALTLSNLGPDGFFAQSAFFCRY